ncbi:S8 family serine peptidase [Fischerella sp. PCC 9605]|uniref:S8 family serine peptidase n=1 Tax=Fischerella sp. PCC 9605 TaxID=1173024 RepID=UPI00047AD7D4|nr:S8 family serine peptidase [Fischerella sp. PCC 9605]
MSSDLAGNSLNTARSFTITTNSQIFTDKISLKDPNDYYKFTLECRSSFQLALTGLKANANVQLIQDGNGNGIADRREVIASSQRSGNKAELIDTTLEAGTYYIRVYPKDKAKTKYDLSVCATPIDNAGNTLDTAYAIGSIPINSEAITYRDWVGNSDINDYYKLSFDSTADLKLTLKDLSADADVRLLNFQGDILAASANVGITSELITSTLAAGTYYIQVYPYDSSQTFYDLCLLLTMPAVGGDSTGAIPTSSEEQGLANNSNSTPAISAINQPTLRADTFTYLPDSIQTVFSGKGNIDFGSGGRDLLDLSAFSSAQVQELNFANFDFTKFSFANTNATTRNQGVLYDPYDIVNLSQARVFDAITVDGKQILFESIDTIKLSDTVIDLSVIPNDALFNQQWNLHVMDVHKAWRFTTGSDNVLIGIEDTGLAFDLNGNIHSDLRTTNVINSNSFDEWSYFSHGTLVQGAIAATSNNDIGIAGINWNSQVMHIDVVGTNPDDYDLAGATQALIDWANSQSKTLVINLSLSGGYSQRFEQLIANNQNNVLFAIATGNDNQNAISSPADLANKYENVIAVGACWGTKDYYGNLKTPGTRVDYLSEGVQWWGSNYGTGLTFVAPSEYASTHATRNESEPFYNYFDYTSYFNGTSASTPNITGVASLVWSVNRGLTAKQIREILAETAYDLGDPGYDTVYGYGIVNADAAIRRSLAHKNYEL